MPAHSSEPTYEYLIITNQALQDEFQVLADWKANWVNGSIVETVGSNASDRDVKDIIDHYWRYHGTKYVLLGGDVAIIPAHIKQIGSAEIHYVAEDFWYANLNWTSSEGEDEISNYEVYVGRAPVENCTEAEHFVNKVIRFEASDKPKANIFHQSPADPEDPDGELYFVRQCENWTPPDYDRYELFQANGMIEKSNWTEFWRNEGIMFLHVGHGGPYLHYIYYNQSANQTVTVEWEVPDIPSLNNTFCPVFTSIACMIGNFSKNDCIAEEYVKADSGPVACLANSDLGYPSSYIFGTCDLVEEQFRLLYNMSIQNIGRVLAESKNNFVAAWYADPYHHCYTTTQISWREINLIGDPETPVLTKRIVTRRPNASGTYTQFPYQYPASGNHWDKVDEETSDGDATIIFVSDSTSGYRDSFNIADFPASENAIIDNVTIYNRVASLGDGLYRGYQRTLIRTHNTDYFGNINRPPTSYVTYSTTYTTNPYTGQAWTMQELNDLEIGVFAQAVYRGGNYWDVYCTQVYVVVGITYT